MLFYFLIEAMANNEALASAALHKLLINDKLQKAVFRSFVDVKKLNVNDGRRFIGRIREFPIEDNEKFLRKLRNKLNEYVIACVAFTL